MFDCKKCESLEAEVAHLRGQASTLQEQIGKLVDRLLAVTAPHALVDWNPIKPSDPKDYYGGGDDEMIEYDEFGQAFVREASN